MKPLLSTIGTDNLETLAGDLTPRDGASPSRPNYPQGVAPHLDSHQDQLTDLIARGEIPKSYENVLRVFIELHDRGYAGEMQTLDAEDFAAHADDYRSTYVRLGATNEEARQMIEYVLAGLRETNPVKQHLTGRVIGHGVNSVRFGVKTLQERGGLDNDQALALSSVYATHHLGFPLTPLVDGFAKFMGSPIPQNLRNRFLVGGDEVPATTADGQSITPEQREAFSQDRADIIRAEIADRAAAVLNISQEDARAIAAVGYALDRMTPARRMREFTLNEDNSFIWKGGETEKIYPLVVGNIDSMIKNPAVTKKPDLHVRSVYDISLSQFERHRDAAVRTAQNLNVVGLESIIRRNSARELGATTDVQTRALAIADRLGVGNFVTIEQDIARVTEEYRRAKQSPTESDDLDALGYLLGTLRVIEKRTVELFSKK